jgi:ubiquinone/menaquinone biosynthesis C-methylase UbiE
MKSVVSAQHGGAAGGGRQSAAVVGYYRRQARIYDCTRCLSLFDRPQAVRALHLSAGQTVLEIGCGTGLNLPLLRRAVGARGTIIGVDLSADMLAVAERKVRRFGWKNVRLEQADATRLQMDVVCDAALFAYSLSIIDDWQQALARALAHLRPGGRLAVLDLGAFAGWGHLAQRIATWWFRRNHVQINRDYRPTLAELLDDLEFHERRGGYNFLAAGTRR